MLSPQTNKHSTRYSDFLYKKKIKKIKGKCVYINRYMRMYTPWKILNKVIDRGKLIMKIKFKKQFNNVTFLWTHTVKMCTFVVDKATSSLFPQCYDLVVVEFNGFFSMVSSIKKTKRKEKKIIPVILRNCNNSHIIISNAILMMKLIRIIWMFILMQMTMKMKKTNSNSH